MITRQLRKTPLFSLALGLVLGLGFGLAVFLISLTSGARADSSGGSGPSIGLGPAPVGPLLPSPPCMPLTEPFRFRGMGARQEGLLLVAGKLPASALSPAEQSAIHRAVGPGDDGALSFGQLELLPASAGGELLSGDGVYRPQGVASPQLRLDLQLQSTCPASGKDCPLVAISGTVTIAADPGNLMSLFRQWGGSPDIQSMCISGVAIKATLGPDRLHLGVSRLYVYFNRTERGAWLTAP